MFLLNCVKTVSKGLIHSFIHSFQYHVSFCASCFLECRGQFDVRISYHRINLICKLDHHPPRSTFTGSICYNGSDCIPFEKGYKSPQIGRTTRCDCATHKTDGVHFYAGYGCEYEADDYCILGEANTGGISFCVNDGTCSEVWRPREGETA